MLSYVGPGREIGSSKEQDKRDDTLELEGIV